MKTAAKQTNRILERTKEDPPGEQKEWGRGKEKRKGETKSDEKVCERNMKTC